MSEFGEDWDDGDWDFVLNRIHDKQCVPFLGAGVNAGILPLGADLAKKLTDTEPQKPLSDTSDLIKVSQYIALRHDPTYAKEQVVRILDEKSIQPGPAHTYLARLPFSIYATTNYDSLMSDALRIRRGPVDVVCQWRVSPNSYPNLDDRTPVNPVVFYFHGSKTDPDSLVLTEDDYLDFLSRMLENLDLLPKTIEKAIRNSSVLFIGYRLADWNLRILFKQLGLALARRGTCASVRREPPVDETHAKDRKSILVFPSPSADDPSRGQIKNYLTTYYQALKIKICWATAEDFLEQLVIRWQQKFRAEKLL